MGHFDISLPFEGVTEQTPIHLGPKTFGLLSNPALLDVVEQFIGDEIYSNPIQHTRIKPPECELPEHLQGSSLLARTDWHQDQGVHLPEADATHMLTVWLPLTDATQANARSRQHPGSVVSDWQAWANLWRQTRARLARIQDAGKFTRWTSEEPICA